MKPHYKSVFDKETDLLKAVIDVHLDGADIECDPMYFKGNFYKDGVKRPTHIFDLNPQVPECPKGDATCLNIGTGKLRSIILDPPFMFGLHGKTREYYSSKTHTIYTDYPELLKSYDAIISESHRVLKPKGILIFKCQDYTDSKTTMVHIDVHNIATGKGFVADDLGILVRPNKVTNPNTKQRHLRKIHTYFYIFRKVKPFGSI